jgi:hypothetical protein
MISSRYLCAPADAPQGFIFLDYWRKISRSLGYTDTARYAGWYWEPAGDELAWYDGRTGVCGAREWYRWMQEIAPLLRHLGYDCGSSEAAAKVWLIADGVTGAVYVARPWEARRFLERQW